jgi:uncharacterized protein YbaP (TraB family)
MLTAERQAGGNGGAPSAPRGLSVRLVALLPAAALALAPGGLGMPLAGAAEAADGSHVFWRLDKAAGGHLFLLGSLHFGDERLYPLPPVVEAAYRDAAVVVFETDLRQTMQPGFGELMRTRAELPPPRTLADLLPAAAIESFRAAARDLGVEPLYLERFRPWYCANQLMSLALRRAGVDPRRGIDQVFCARAVSDNKPIEMLETPEFQVELFAGLEEQQAAVLLTESLAEVSHVRDFVERLLAAYVDGDLRALAEVVTASFDGVPELRRRFLSDRNATWMPRLEELARREGSQFVVVGTGHLLGEDGVIARLRRSGYRVTRL